MSSSVDIGAATAASRGLYLAHPLKNHDIQFESTRKNLPTGLLCFFFSFKLADSLDRDPESLPNCGMEAVALSSCLEEEELESCVVRRRHHRGPCRCRWWYQARSDDMGVAKTEIKGGAVDKQA